MIKITLEKMTGRDGCVMMNEREEEKGTKRGEKKKKRKCWDRQTNGLGGHLTGRYFQSCSLFDIGRERLV